MFHRLCGVLKGETMSRSIHETVSSVFKNKSKREINEMCDPKNPDYKVVELWKKHAVKKESSKREKKENFSKV